MLLWLCVSWLVLCGAESRHWSGFRKVFNKFDYEAPPSSPPSYNTLYFHQQLDHFNYVNTAVWKQKYLSSGELHSNVYSMYCNGVNTAVWKQRYLSSGELHSNIL